MLEYKSLQCNYELQYLNGETELRCCDVHWILSVYARRSVFTAVRDKDNQLKSVVALKIFHSEITR